jgi:hypothetical protein
MRKPESKIIKLVTIFMMRMTHKRRYLQFPLNMKSSTTKLVILLLLECITVTKQKFNLILEILKIALSGVTEQVMTATKVESLESRIISPLCGFWKLRDLI